MNTRQDAFNKLKGIVSNTPSQWHEDAKRRAEEKPWKRRSQAVALVVLRTLRAKKRSQKDLAEQLGVSPQLINKWVKGNENFTFETVAKLEEALGIQLMQITGLKSGTARSKGYILMGSINMFKQSYEPNKTVSTEAKVVPITSKLDYVPQDQYAAS